MLCSDKQKTSKKLKKNFFGMSVKRIQLLKPVNSINIQVIFAQLRFYLLAFVLCYLLMLVFCNL